MAQKTELKQKRKGVIIESAIKTIEVAIPKEEEVGYVPVYKMARKWIELEDSNFPEDLYYSTDHIWIKLEAYGTVRIGLTDLGQKIIGPIGLIRLRHEGKKMSQGGTFGRFHGARIWVGPFKAPISGKIIEINKRVIVDPALVNMDPYGIGWLIRMKSPKIDEEIKNLYWIRHIDAPAKLILNEKAVGEMYL